MECRLILINAHRACRRWPDPGVSKVRDKPEVRPYIRNPCEHRGLESNAIKLNFMVWIPEVTRLLTALQALRILCRVVGAKA